MVCVQLSKFFLITSFEYIAFCTAHTQTFHQFISLSSAIGTIYYLPILNADNFNFALFKQENLQFNLSISIENFPASIWKLQTLFQA